MARLITSVLLIVVAVTGVGLTFFVISELPELTLNREVNLLDLCSAFLVFALAVAVPYLISHPNDRIKSEKVLLIDEISVLSEFLSQIDALLSDARSRSLTQDEFNRILNLFKKSRMQLSFVKQNSSRFGVITTKNMRTFLDSYQDVVTGNKGAKPEGFVVTDHFLLYQSVVYDRAAREARRLKFDVNSR